MLMRRALHGKLLGVNMNDKERKPYMKENDMCSIVGIKCGIPNIRCVLCTYGKYTDIKLDGC
jgi:hypothetical protein